MAKAKKEISQEVTQEMVQEVVQEVKQETKSKNVRTFTYIGAGSTSPQIINFMNKFTFMRGKPTEIEINAENAPYLKKLSGCPSFKEGIVDPEALLKSDMQAQEIEKQKKEADKKINEAVKRKNKE